MSADQRHRTALRSVFTREAKALRELLDNPETTHTDLRAGLESLSNRYKKLADADEKVLQEFLAKSEDGDGTLEDELFSCGQYELTFNKFKEEVQGRLQPTPVVTLQSQNSPGIITCQGPKLKMKRPEIKKFGGEIKHWITFWAQFSKIHEDKDVSPEDKFALLLDALIPGSPAQRLLENIPQSSANYQKAVDLLEARYGKEELLIEYYVRELLSLVLKRGENTIAELHDQLIGHLRALDSLGLTKQKFAAIIYPLVESSVPEDLFRVWERVRKGKGASIRDAEGCLTELLSFLEIEVEGEERLKLRRTTFEETLNDSSDDKATTSIPSAAALVSTSGSSKGALCIFCERPHNSADCSKAGDMTLDERTAFVKRRGACFRCLRIGHINEKCRTFVKCFICKGKHYPLLCQKISLDSDPKEFRAGTEAPEKVETKAMVAGYQTARVVYLQTLVVQVVSAGSEFSARILIDSGSQKSYILKSRVKEFKLKRQGKVLVQQELFGGQKTAVKSHSLYKVQLKSKTEPFQCEFEVLDQEKICGFVPKVTDKKLFESLQNRGMYLTDYTVSDSKYEDIDILLGADAWPLIITDQVVKLDKTMIAVNTKLGWSVMGSVNEKSSVSTTMLVTLLSQAHLSHFWELETLGIKDPGVQKTQSEKEQQTNAFFEKTVKRTESGRYSVKLPWTEGHPDLEGNREIALARLMATTARLETCNKYEGYDSVIQDWIQKGIVEVAPNDDIEGKFYYLPHRAVFKEHSTTKIRPVFDASCQGNDGRSLNGCLEKGPNQIELIPTVITHWRQFPIGVSADIEKAFLMIEIDAEDRDWLRFLWWDKGKVITLRHCRVVFGVSSSPYLLSAVLKHHLKSPPSHLVETANKLLRSFYVDNCLSGTENAEELERFMKESQELLEPAGFNLRGWVSNLAEDKQEENVLGLYWDCQNDTLRCNMKLIDRIPTSLTRRTLLSSAHRLYDPIGFTEPTKLIPRAILQRAHDPHEGWDDPLSEEVAKDFKDWLSEIHLLDGCRLPRRIYLNSSSTVHVFCDASKIAFATCIFIRTEREGTVEICLLMAKARVAPRESPSLPRLELLAALAGVRLHTLARQGLDQEAERTFFWTDSSVVLAWITGNQQWSIFVENRVKEIRDCSLPEQWRHIPGTENPADLLSRGCSPSQLLTSKWWEGPSWLRLPESEWPSSQINTPVEDVMKEKRKLITLTVAAAAMVPSILGILTERISDYFRIIKVVMLIIDAVCIFAPSFMKYTGLTESDVLKRKFTSIKFLNAEMVVLKLIQLEYFDENRRKSELKGFNAFYDSKGLLRVKSRVLDGGSSYEFNHPIILPGKHPLIMKMIDHLHVINHHAGVLTLLTILRERIWLICGRQSVSKVVRRCIACRKQAAQSLQVPVGPLPADRTKPAAPFQVVGVDLAGPLFLRNHDKVWIAIFTCAVYRGVHLELVSALSTEAFVRGLRRFISRRGRPRVVYSDNGTNFVGLDNLFRLIDWSQMEKEFSLQRIQWKFNPPSAPWWGGFWERLIRILKDLLKRNLGRASLNYEELETLLCECESLINNRPLTYVSEDPLELAPLRPAMFMQGLPSNDMEDLNSIEKHDIGKNWRYLEELRNGLKTRFCKEYLGILRSSKPAKTDHLEIGDIVLIGSDNKKRLDWPLGKVIDLKVGRDGLTRLAKLLTKNGEVLRPFQRLYPLELHSATQVPSSDPESSGLLTESHNEAAQTVHADNRAVELGTESEPTMADGATEDVQDEDITDPSQQHTRSGRRVRRPVIMDL